MLLVASAERLHTSWVKRGCDKGKSCHARWNILGFQRWRYGSREWRRKSEELKKSAALFHALPTRLTSATRPVNGNICVYMFRTTVLIVPFLKTSLTPDTSSTRLSDSMFILLSHRLQVDHYTLPQTSKPYFLPFLNIGIKQSLGHWWDTRMCVWSLFQARRLCRWNERLTARDWVFGFTLGAKSGP